MAGNAIMAEAPEIISEIDAFVRRTFDEVVPEEGSYNSSTLTRRVEIGIGQTAVFQEFPNPSGTPSGEHILTFIDSTLVPPEVTSLISGSRAGHVICESHNPQIATVQGERSFEVWAGAKSPRGLSLLRTFAGQLSIEV